MGGTLEEILDRVRQHPRLVVVDDYELFVERSSSWVQAFSGGKPFFQEKDSRLWLCLRLLHRKQPGRASMQAATEESLNQLIDSAFDSAKFSSPDPWFRFPIWKAVKTTEPLLPKPLAMPPTVFSQVPQLDPLLKERYEIQEREIRLVRKTEKNTLSDYGRKYFSRLSLPFKDHVELFDERAQSLPLVGQVSWAKALQLRAIEQRDSVPFHDFAYSKILITPLAMVRLLKKIAPAFYGDRVQEGKSFLGIPRGEKLFSPVVTIIDDGTLQDGVFSSRFDDEGTLTQQTVLVCEGEYRANLLDTYSATRENRLSTGNFRKGWADTFAGVAASHFYLSPSATPLREMVSQMDRGFVVESWDYEGFDPREGRLALVGRGWEVEGGSPLRPVYGKAISCRVIDLLRHVVSVGNDLTFHGAFASPSILCEDLPLDI